jgi:serine/threonine protein phosphatase PrpC/ribosomal protein L37E
MECPNCGQENRNVAHFCQRCGHRLQQVEVEQDAAEGTVVEEAVEQPVELEASAAAPDEQDTALEEEPETMPEAELPTEEFFDTEITLIAPAEADAESAPEVKAADKADGAEGVELESAPPADDVEALAEAEPEPVETEMEATDVEERAEAEIEVTGMEADAIAEAVDELGAAETEPLAEAVGEAEEETPAEAPPDEEMIAEPLEETEDQETLVPLETEEEPVEAEYEDEMKDLTDAGLFPWRDEVERTEALGEGAIVQGRYRVIEVLLTDSQENLYRVRDLKRCPQCGSTDNSPDEAFCASCGATLDEKPVATMMERPVARSAEPVEAEVENQFTEGERAYWVWREIVRREDEGAARRPMNMAIGQKSDTGMVRELDEDGLFVLTMSRTLESVQDTVALFVVADGMGGHEGGEIASKVAIQTMANILLHNVFIPELEGIDLAPDEIQDWMRRAGEVANDQVYLERQKRQNDMGTTLTAALLKNWTLYLAHIGDCRAYRWGEAGLEQLTTDHSVVASMVAAGTAAPDEIYTHPQRSVIYRCVGDQPSVEVDTDVQPINPGDRLVLCCDGLWEMLRTEGIEDVLLRESDPQQACEILVEQANLAGGNDNISVLIVQL